MKALYALPLLYQFSFSISFAQNWQLVNPDYHYHYVIRNASGQETDSLKALTIRIDSTDSDTSMLNVVLDWKKYYFEGEEIEVNLPQFLNKDMIDMGSGKRWFQNPGSFVLFEENIPQSWLFDTINAIQAQLDTTLETSVYGQLDSVRSILLSNGDTILQARSFGILQFPISDSTALHYRQIGINRADVGFNFPDKSDMYDFQMGDKFEFHIDDDEYYTTGGSSDWDKKTEIVRQWEVIDIDTSQVGVKKYQMKEITRTTKTTYSPYVQVFTETSFSFEETNRWVDFAEIDLFPDWIPEAETRDVWETYPGELFYLTLKKRFPFTSVTYEIEDKCGDKITRKIDLNSCYTELYPEGLLAYQSRKPVDFYCLSMGSGATGGSIHWTEGLGYTNISFYSYPDIKSYEFRQRMVAFRKNGQNCGTFSKVSELSKSPFNIQEPPDPEMFSGDYIDPFINPVSESFRVFPNPKYARISMQMMDVTGRQVLDMEIEGVDPQTIALPDHIFGLHFVRFTNQSGNLLALYKLIVQ